MVYAAVSRGYQLAPAGLLFTQAPMLGGLVYLTADKNMPATTLMAYEAGYRTRLSQRVNMEFDLFCHHYENFETEAFGLGPPGLLTMQLRNDAEAVTYGLEWEGRYNVTDALTLLGNYTLELTDWPGPEPIHMTDIMPAPQHKFMVGARYSPLQDLHLSAHMYYVGDTQAPDSVNVLFFRHVPAYVRLDLRAEYEFWKTRASVAVGVRNLIDPEHFEGGTRFMNSAEVPRMVYGEIRIRLN